MRSSVQGGEHLILLDACCLINLFATGRAEEILRALPHRFAVARFVVEEELLQIASGEERAAARSGERRTTLRPLLADLIEKEVLTELEISTPDEKQWLVRFAAELDDGEAHTCALAQPRGARVATDDKKALRVLRAAWEEKRGEKALPDPCIRTSDLLFEWAKREGVADLELAQIVQAIARRASFFPPRNDLHFDRWMDLLGGRE